MSTRCKNRQVWLGGLVLVLLFGAAGSLGAQQTVVIRGGTLIDGNGGPPLNDALLVIRNGRISRISQGTAEIPAGSRVIEAGGKTILPGFIDGHVHYRPWHGELNLAYGVTTLVDLGNPDEWMLALIQGRQMGHIRMPRIYASGARLGAAPSIRREKLMQNVASHKPHFLFVEVDEAKRRIREKKERGISVIKVDETWRREDLRQIVETAHALDLPVVGHATDPRDAAYAGQDCIIHLYSLVAGTISDPAKLEAFYRREVEDIYSLMDPATFPDLIELLISRNVAINVQFGSHWPLENAEVYQAEDLELFTRPDLEYIPLVARVNVVRNHHHILSLKRSEIDNFRNHYQRFVREFVEAGGTAVLGTDTVAFSLPGVAAYRDLIGLHESGVETMKVIQAATRNPAKLYRLADVGTLEVGKFADLQIINGNPLQDLTSLRNIDLLMIGGEVVDRSFHAGYHNIFDRPYPEDTGPGLPPVLGSISPRSAPQGSREVILTVSGSKFDAFTRVLFDGMPLETQLMDARTLRATLPAILLERPGTFRVGLDDPRFLGEPSSYYGFVVSFAP